MRKILFVLMTSTIMMVSCDISAGNAFGAVDRGNSYKPLGVDFKPFDYTNDRANLVFYITVDMSQMDTTVDNPTPSLTVGAVSYTPCTLIVSNADNGLIHSVTDTLVRYKGNTTFDKPKPQFRIKFSDNNKFYGYRRINLHSEWKDATLMREKLSYDFMHEAGVVAPRANHVRVYLNDTSDSNGYTYYGLYTMVEAIDKLFIKHHISIISNNGNLYKMYYGLRGGGQGFATLEVLGGGAGSDYLGGNGFAKSWPNARAYRLRSNEDVYMENYSDISSLINTINSSTTGTTYQNLLSGVMDVEGFLNWLAANTLLGGWDNYFHNAQNYYLYNIENSGYWYWIAWDYDNSLGNQFSFTGIENEDIYYSSHPELKLIQKVLAVPAWKTYYTNKLQQLINSNFNTVTMGAKIDALKTIIQPFALADTKKQYNNTIWAGNIDSTYIDTATPYELNSGGMDTDPNHLGIKTYIAQRESSVQGQLGGGGFPSTYSQMYLRGTATPTTWALPGTPMTLVNTNLWSVTISGVTNGAEFKFSPTVDWATSWGDDDINGVAETSTNNIVVTVSGTVIFTLNDSTMQYTQSN